MIMGIENSNIPITRDSIKTKLLQEVKDDVCRKSSNDDTALQVKLKDSWNETNVSKKPRCYNCNKYSHFSRDCRSKRKTKPTTQEPKLANTATNSIFFMALKVDNTNSTDWYVDSGASAHMSNNPCDMSLLKIPFTNEVIVANNESVPIEAMGSK